MYNKYNKLKIYGKIVPASAPLVKNDTDFNDLKVQDYFVQHVFDFIMLVTGIIHGKLNEVVKRIDKSSVSIYKGRTHENGET